MPAQDVESGEDEVRDRGAGGAAFTGASAGGGVDPAERSAGAMHIEIVEYLKTVKPPLQADFTDIQRELGIDLSNRRNAEVLDMILSNRKIETERRSNNDFSAGEGSSSKYGGGGAQDSGGGSSGNAVMFLFSYRAKHDVRNRAELLGEIDRVQTGVALKDLCSPLCYPAVVMDVEVMILRGEVIAYSNKEFQLVLYPRGAPFLVPLSGTVTATAGSELLHTDTNLTGEIRRGDAVRVGSHNWDWYRVSCHGHPGQQLQRQKAPCSVTSDRDIDTQGKNVYRYDYTDTWLPLDGDYDSSNAVGMIERALAAGEQDAPHGTLSRAAAHAETEAPAAITARGTALETLAVSTKAYRHGVPNDVRDLWRETAASLEPFHDNDDAASLRLRELLARHKLIAATDVRNVSSSGAGVKRSKKDEAKERRKRRNKVAPSAFNTHLAGGQLERALAEAGGDD